MSLLGLAKVARGRCDGYFGNGYAEDIVECRTARREATAPEKNKTVDAKVSVGTNNNLPRRQCRDRRCEVR